MICYAYSKPEEKTVQFENTLTRWKFKLVPKDGKIFRWTFVNNTKDIEGEQIEKKLVNYALLGYKWRFNINFEYTEDLLKADIVIMFKTPDQDNYLTGGVIAYAGFPNTPYQGQLVLNDKELFSEFGEGVNAHLIDPVHYPDPNTLVRFASIKLVQTLKHEIGHILGLVHNEVDNNSVMFPFYSKTRVMLQRDDIIDMNGKYGKNPSLDSRITHRKLEFLERKLLKNQKLL